MNLILIRLYIMSFGDSAEIHAVDKFYFKMPVKMPDALYDVEAFLRILPRAQCDRVALFPGGQAGVWSMRVAVRGASIDQYFQLPRNIPPIGRRCDNDAIRSLHGLHDRVHIILILYTFSCVVTAGAAQTIMDVERA